MCVMANVDNVTFERIIKIILRRMKVLELFQTCSISENSIQMFLKSSLSTEYFVSKC